MTVQERGEGLGDIFTQNTLSAIKAVCQVLAQGLCGRGGALGGRSGRVCVGEGLRRWIAPCEEFSSWWATGDHCSVQMFLSLHRTVLQWGKNSLILVGNNTQDLVEENRRKIKYDRLVELNFSFPLPLMIGHRLGQWGVISLTL